MGHARTPAVRARTRCRPQRARDDQSSAGRVGTGPMPCSFEDDASRAHIVFPVRVLGTPYLSAILRRRQHEYPELADIAKTAEKIILFENEDKSCLYQDESEDLKKRIIFSIQKNVKI